MAYSGELQDPKEGALSHRHRFVKTAMQTLATASIFSAVFFFFFFYSPLFYLQLKLFFAAHSVQYLSYGSNKNYMFLLCNGILAILTKNSGIIKNSSSSSSFPRSSPPHQSNKPVLKENAPGLSLDMETTLVTAHVRVQEQGNAGAPVDPGIRDGDEIEGEGSTEETEAETLLGGDEEEEDIEAEGEEEEEEEEEEDDDDDDDDDEGGMSTEELNWKCEDFIKRMKREINFESD